MMTDEKINDSFPDQTDEQPAAPQSELAIQLRPRLEIILNEMVENEVIEFEPEKRELLFAEMTEAAENARNPKAILKAILYALIKSENVEEIYGSDPELLQYIKKAIAV